MYVNTGFKAEKKAFKDEFACLCVFQEAEG